LIATTRVLSGLVLGELGNVTADFIATSAVAPNLQLNPYEHDH